MTLTEAAEKIYGVVFVTVILLTVGLGAVLFPVLLVVWVGWWGVPPALLYVALVGFPAYMEIRPRLSRWVARR